MASEEHLKILKQGVEIWNQWRKENPETVPNLVEADLRGEDLKRFNLRGSLLILADFSGAHLATNDPNWQHVSRTEYVGADLRYADLSHADLSGANLFDAYMYQAKLRGSNLNDADLRWANLLGADLRETNLRGADLFRAALQGADLRHCTMAGTVLGDIDLSTVEGLETVRITGPCTIGIDTIYKSEGRIPEAFLRGAGVPDSMIEFARSLVASEKAIDYYSCFISYSSGDGAFAEQLHADLQDNGVRCWFAPEDMKIGDKIRPTLDRSVHMHDKLLIVLSENSVASDWVEQEVETALARERQEERTVLFPIRLDDTVVQIDVGWPALIRNTRHIGDFSNWKDHDAYQHAFGRLLRDLKAEEPVAED